MLNINKKNNDTQSSEASLSNSLTRIGEGVVFTGNMKCIGDVRVDGELNGNIETNSRIIIGPKGLINGDVICKSAEIEGKVIGKLVIKDLLSLKASAFVQGEVSLAKLSVLPGAIFNVSCKMLTSTSPSK